MSQLVSVDQLVTDLGRWNDRSGPRYQRLADALEDLLGQEPPAPGTRLPSERELAQRLGLSRGTVVAAYTELAERGLVSRRQGSGTRVIGDQYRSPAVPSMGVAGAASGDRPAYHRFPQLTRLISDTAAAPLDLSFGAPYLDDLVADLSGDALTAVRAGAPAHGYAPLGLPALRAAIAERSGAPADHVLVTNGGQGALSLLTAALVRPGDRVIVEAPTYPGAIELFSRAGATIVALGRDHAGPRPDDVRRVLSGLGAALVYLVPTCHNPTGSIMHEQRRRELLAVCAEHDVTVVEDGTTAEMVFDGAAPPALGELDPERVISIGSFSKVLWGGLRVGWIRASRRLVLRLGRLKAAQDLGDGVLDQLAVLTALPRLDEIVAARRRQARERHDVLAGALAERLPDWRIAPCRGGYSLWVRLSEGTGDELAAAALARGVAIAAGSASAPQDLFLDHVRLCFAAPPDLLVEAVDRLAAAWEDVRVRPAALVRAPTRP
jgi:DNA-binding transcriptional MocR family regulator